MKTVLETLLTIYNKTIKKRIVFYPMEGCDGTFVGAVDELTRRRDMRFAKTDEPFENI